MGLFGVLAPTARVESLTVRGTARGAARGAASLAAAPAPSCCQSFCCGKRRFPVRRHCGPKHRHAGIQRRLRPGRAQELAGGLAGQNGGLIALLCRGRRRWAFAGGLVGEQTAQGRLSNCYTAAPVSGQGSAAALAANAGSLSRVYYCTDEGYTGPEKRPGRGAGAGRHADRRLLQELNAVD